MAADEGPPIDTMPPEPMPWDRLGMFCEDLFTVTRTMAARNQGLWSSMSQNLGKQAYTADDATTDAAKAMSAAMANVQDVIDLWIRYPERERVAAASTTAFLLFTPEVVDAGLMWTCEDSIWMRLPSSSVEQYPKTAEIEISGPNLKIAAALKDCLATRLGESRQAYRLYTNNLQALNAVLAGVPKAARAGVYTGSVYVKRPTVMLVGNLRIVIEPGRGLGDAQPVE